MKCRATTLTLICTTLIGVTPGFLLAQSSNHSSADVKKWQNRLRADTEQPRRELAQTLKRTRMEMNQRHWEMKTQLRNPAPWPPPSLPVMRRSELRATSAGLLRSAVMHRPLPKASFRASPMYSTRPIWGKAATDILMLPLNSAGGAVAPGAGAGVGVWNVYSTARAAHDVAKGKATPSALNGVIPSVVYALNRLGTPIDFYGLQNLQWTTPLGHTEPGLSHLVTGWSTNFDTRHDPLTNTDITTTSTRMTTKFHMNGNERNRHYRARFQNGVGMINPPRIKTTPLLGPQWNNNITNYVRNNIGLVKPSLHMPIQRVAPLPRLPALPKFQTYSRPNTYLP